MNIRNLYIIACTCLLLSTSIFSKSWLTYLKNESDSTVTLVSNDPSSGNGILGLNGRFDYKKQSPITITAGQQVYFNDFVIPWKQFGAQITITTSAGNYTLQEDNNQLVFTSAEHPDWNITLKHTGTWDAVGIYVDRRGRLDAKYIA